MRNKFWLMTLAVLAAAFGFLALACGGGSEGSGGVAPQSVTVTTVPAAEMANRGSSVQFRASVLPADADQTVTWQVTPSGRATIDADGLLTIREDAPDGTLTVRAITADLTQFGARDLRVLVPPYLRFVHLPSRFNGRTARIWLFDGEHTTTGTNVGVLSEVVEGSSVVFPIPPEVLPPGEYVFQLSFGTGAPSAPFLTGMEHFFRQEPTPIGIDPEGEVISLNDMV